MQALISNPQVDCHKPKQNPREKALIANLKVKKLRNLKKLQQRVNGMLGIVSERPLFNSMMVDDSVYLKLILE